MAGPWEDFDALLGSVIVVWTLVIGMVVALFVQALAALIAGSFFENKNARDASRRARGVVGNGIDLFGSVISSMIQLLVQGVTVMIGIVSYFLLVLIFAAALHVLYLYFPVVLGSFTAGWNDSVGEFWSRYVIGALEVLQVIFERLVGIYNFLIFALFKVPLELFIHATTAGFPDLVSVGVELGGAGVEFYEAFARLDRASRADCGSVQIGTFNTTCVRADLRDVNLVPTFRRVNRAVAHFTDFLPRTCAVLTQPMTVLFFPLMDIEMSWAVHHFVNAIQHTVFQVTALSVKRWELSERFSTSGGRGAIVIPDTGPVFDHVANMFSRLGKTVDNWIDVALYAVVTLGDPAQEIDCDEQQGRWEFPAAGVTSASFGGNHTVMTQLTPTMFALTDGYTIEYHHHGRNANTRIQTEAWPIPINISYGIAAVAYARDLSRDDNTGGHTTALMGCSCVDGAEADGTQTGIELFCAIAPYELFEGLKRTAFVVNMTWEVANTPRLMVCRDTKIAVESIRYQAQRITSPNEWELFGNSQNSVSCFTKDSCTRIDAAVWVMPVCPLANRVNGGSTAGNEACLRGLKDFSCFPFCLGVHRSFSANERMIIRSSSAWERNVLLTSRDCTLQSADTFEAVSSELLERTETTHTGTWIPNTRVGDMENVQIKKSENSRACQVQEDAVSSVPLLQSELFESSQMFQEAHLAAETGWDHTQDNPGDLYRFTPTDAMLLERQPFVFAGDMAVRTMTTCRNGILWEEGRENECTTVVDVMQITGSEFNQFTLRHIVPTGIPVTRRPSVISNTEEVLTPGRVTLPPVIVRSVYLHNPAASTYDSFWYAVNPDYEMLHCVLRYCNGFQDLVNCMQFSVLSNYESIRVWKVIPQAGCVRNQDNGRAECPPQTAQSVAFDDEFNMRIGAGNDFDVATFCDSNKLSNLYVEDLEEFDPLNMAVAVRRGNAQALYDELWGGGGARTHSPVSATVYYFINTQTLEIREGFPWVEPVTTGVNTGYLCSDLRFGPTIGSAVGELLVSQTLMWKTIVGLVLNVPGLVWLFDDPSERCVRSSLAMHHSFFEECGTKYMDFTDAFEALNRANIHAWSILDFAARVLDWSVANEFAVDSLTLYLRGERMYKENRVMLARSPVTSTATDVFNLNRGRFVSAADRVAGESTSVRVLLTIGSPEFMSGMSIAVAPVAYAEYFMRLLGKIIDRTIVIAREREGRNGATTFRYVVGNWTTIWYESIYTDWEDLVSTRARRMCTGIALMNGYTNPWAQFLLHWCLAGVEFSDGIMHALGAFMVEIPMAVCVCITSVEHNFREYVREKCVPETSPILRPFLAAMVLWDADVEFQRQPQRQSLMQTSCQQTLDVFEDSVYNVFTDWAAQHTEAGVATTSLFDFIGVLLQQDSAQCTNFVTNPFVSVIVPNPIDYFRACTDTAICKARCKDYQDLLDTALAGRNGAGTLPPVDFRTTIESSMFGQFRVGDYEDTYMRLVAVCELPIVHDDCGKCDFEGDDCVSVVGLENGRDSVYATQFTVRTYCVPVGMNHKVFTASTWHVEDDPVVGPLGMVGIEDGLDPDNHLMRVLRVVYSLPYGDHVVLLTRSRNVVVDDLLYVGTIEQITVWRSNQLLKFAAIANTVTLLQRCAQEMEDSIDPGLLSLPPEFDNVDDYNLHVKSAKMMDILIVPGGEYTIDMVVQLEVSWEASHEGKRASSVAPIYIRVGWCEYIPSNFHGVHRSTPTRCVGLSTNHYECAPMQQESLQTLFTQWLSHGVLLNLPWRTSTETQNVWVPSSSFGGSTRQQRVIFAVNISMSDGFINVLNLQDPEYLITSGRDTRKSLPSRPYITGLDFQGIEVSSYSGQQTSLIAHQRDDPSQYDTFNTEKPAIGLWYIAASPIIARSWLREVRYNPRLFTLQALASRKVPMQIKVDRYCNGYSCQGCDTLQLRQTCAALQTCVTVQCIGTTVNTGSILCNAGMFLESTYSAIVGIYISAWHAVASLILAILRQSVEVTADIPYQFRITLISDLAHTFVCETKDILATITSVFATLLQVSSIGSSQAVGQSDVVSYGLRQASEVNTEAYAEKTLQVSAFHQFMFQIFIGPLYFVMGVYRWGFCTVSNVLDAVTNEVTLVSLGSMDSAENGATWGACTTEVAVSQILSATRSLTFFEGMASIIQDSFEGRDDIDDRVEQGQEAAIGAAQARFVKKSPHRVMKPIDLMLHLFDAAMAWLSGVLTGAQDIIYNFDEAKCRVPDISMQDSTQCACGDEMAYIEPVRRTESFVNGAFWCVGTLYMPRRDGTYGYIYNPYSMEELGNQLFEMDVYLECISKVDGENCENSKPEVFVLDRQDVNPMAVLTRCRSNYMQQQWDIGTHALFDPDFNVNVYHAALPFETAREQALEWAEGVAPEMRTCVDASATSAETFSQCLSIFLRLRVTAAGTVGSRTESYFAYRMGNDGEQPSTNPDACKLYTGPALEAETEETRARYSVCLDGENANPETCDLPALAWTGNLYSRVPVGVVHREAIVDPAVRLEIARSMHQLAKARIKRAIDGFDRNSLDAIDTFFFSAEGDALHQMMDCMFMGPYAKIDYLIADDAGNLPTLTWFRDANGGQSREFDLPCENEKLHGDEEGAPFTCGSAARRAIIKQYVRGEFLADVGASNITAELILDVFDAIVAEWLDETRYGCPNPANPSEHGIQFCGVRPEDGGSRFQSGLGTFWQVSSGNVVESVVQHLPAYYQRAMTDAEKWKTYYVDNIHSKLWGSWKGNEIAQDLHLFAPHEPVVEYSTDECMDVENGNTLKNSMWGVCTALVSQPMLTLPLSKTKTDGTADDETWMPKFMRTRPLGDFDPFSRTLENPYAVEDWMTALLEEAWIHSPMYAHYNLRHVPSKSNVCKSAKHIDLDNIEHAEMLNNVQFTKFQLTYADGTTEELVDLRDVSVPFVSFEARTVGSVANMCPCSRKVSSLDSDGVSSFYCVFAPDTCTKLLHTIATFELNITTFLENTCGTSLRTFDASDVAVVYAELQLFGRDISCEELQVTDQWGLFPYDFDQLENNNIWVATAEELSNNDGSYLYDAANLLVHYKMGLSPATIRHVISSVKNGTSGAGVPASRRKPLGGFFGETVAQSYCMDATGEQIDEESIQDLTSEFVHALFPVAQMVWEPSGLSTCTRYMIDLAKFLFMRDVLKLTNYGEYEVSMERWRERCAIKTRQAILCDSLDIFRVIPLREEWQAILPPMCTFPIDEDSLEGGFGTRFYITPGCVLYGNGEWYDVRKCRDLDPSLPFAMKHLVDTCRMYTRAENVNTETRTRMSTQKPNPFVFTHESGHGVLHWGDGSQFRDKGEYLQNIYNSLTERETKLSNSRIGVDLSFVFVHALFNNMMNFENTGRRVVLGNMDPGACPNGIWGECEKAEFCDRVFDWWPEDMSDPVGYHPTATCMADDNAYRTFDSYITVDRERMKMVYEHQTMRDASVAYQWSGTNGLCRLHSVYMPLFETNTHRVCTQSPETMPNPVLPFDRNENTRNSFLPEKCSESASDVPWDATDPDLPPWFHVFGNVAGFVRMTEAGQLGRHVVGERYPSSLAFQKEIVTLKIGAFAALTEDSLAPLLPKAGYAVPSQVNNANDPWDGCIPPLEVVSCNTLDAESCPNEMLCMVAPGQPENVGLCLPIPSTIGHDANALPCYRSDMCAENDHCLAKGHCGRVQMHLWNSGNDPIEFTTLVQDTCGTETNPQYPYTQDMEGASPWELLPDLLQGHGMCAQRHQYSYRYAMANSMEGRIGNERAYLRKEESPEDATDRRYVWPWVQQGPSGKLFEEGRESDNELDTRFMHLHPHPCDRNYMHQPGQKVCSGIAGDPTLDMIPYEIHVHRDPVTNLRIGWSRGADKVYALNRTRWMRSTDPEDRDRVLVGAMFDSDDYKSRGSFAFLGGDKRGALGVYNGSVGRSDAKFVHCSTLQMCGSPVFTFNGINAARGAFVGAGGTWKWFNAGDFASCGSIGFVRAGSVLAECTFDIALFPIVRLLVSRTSIFCTEVFGVPGGSAEDGNENSIINVVDVVLDLGRSCPVGKICCLGGVQEDDVECKFRAIGLDSSASSDGKTPFPIYEVMIDKLNNMHLFGTISQSFTEKVHTTEGLGIITECIEDIVRVNRRNQFSFAATKYNAPENAISGLYQILRFHLYEVPWLWYYKWVYKNIVINTQNLQRSIVESLVQWRSLVSIGESWSSRTSLESTTIRRCNELSCKCNILASVRDVLQCINGGVRLRVPESTSVNVAESLTQWDLDTEVKNEYFTALRQAIRSKVMGFLLARYGMDEDEPGTFVPGCSSEAYWNISRCRQDDFCMLFLAQNASGRDNGIQYTFDARDPFFYEYFEYDAKIPQSSTCVNILATVNKLLESYQFIDEKFEPLDSNVRSFVENSDDTVWKYPLFKLLDEPAFEDPTDAELNADTCGGSGGGGWFVTDHKSVPENEKECVFAGTYDPRESAADPEVSTRPKVIFSSLPKTNNGNILFDPGRIELDVCSENSGVAKKRSDGKVRMGCSFQDEADLHGRDYCDHSLPNQYQRFCFKENLAEESEQNTIGLVRDFLGADVSRFEDMTPPFYHCTDNSFGSSGSADHRRKYGDVSGKWREITPRMRCTESPAFDTTCKGKLTVIEGSSTPGSSRKVSGYYGNWVGFVNHYMFDDAEINQGENFPVDALEDELQYVLLPNAERGWALNTGCPAHVDPWIDGITSDNVDAETIPQFHELYSMCHYLEANDACFPFESERVNAMFAAPREPNKSPCTIQRVQLPPGVAGRFFTTTGNFDYETGISENDPVFTQCPNADETPSSYGSITVPVVRKSQSRWYNNIADVNPSPTNNNIAYPGFTKDPALVACTRQNRAASADPTDDVNQCVGGDESDANCHIVSETKNVEWRLEDNPACDGLGGICQWSLTLAEGFFCGTGTAIDDNRDVTPPSRSCGDPKKHKFLVRGRETNVRSLWKCDRCIDYKPLQYQGLMRCGFSDLENPLVTTSPREIIENVKDFIRTEIHSIEKIGELHRSREFDDLKYANDANQPYYPTSGSIAYVNLAELSFSNEFATWHNSEPGECKPDVSSLTGFTTGELPISTIVDECTWNGQYDVTALQERDDIYFDEIALLECSVESPELYEYEQCSGVGNEPREILREWVDSYYRTGQGTWMPVLPSGHGVKWDLDRSAVVNPFTLLYASANRPMPEKYSSYILSDNICRQNSVLSGMCVKITNETTNVQYVQHINPWLGGEFNPDLVSRTLDNVMGLDQCQRLNGLWEGCCSCFPASMCCYPKTVCDEGEAPPNNDLFENNYFGGNVYRTQCNEHDFEYPRSQPMPLDDPTNICLRDVFENRPNTCRHNQGVLGGVSGVGLSSVGELYEDEYLSVLSRRERFLRYSDGINVWGGALSSAAARYRSGEYTRMEMPDNLLYPAHIVLQNTNEQNLLVHAFRMNSGPLTQNTEIVQPVKNWVPTLHRKWAQDSDIIKRLYPFLDVNGSVDYAPRWDCPLRSVSFWGKDTPGFNPLIPDPVRSDFMFRGHFYCINEDQNIDPFTNECVRGVHPFHEPQEYNGIRDYVTMNGACFYDTGLTDGDDVAEQTIPISDKTHTCGFRKQMRALLEGTWQTSRVMSNESLDCDETIDWPSQSLPFRNGEEDDRTMDVDAQRCRLLPRVANFRMKIKSDAPLREHPTRTTMDKGGDCHMGRAARVTEDERSAMYSYEHCITVARTSTQAHVRCTAPKDNGARLTAADRIFILEREQKQRPLEDVVLGDAGALPIRCGECDAHKTPMEGPGGVDLTDTETSVGTIQRISTMRSLADEISRVCEREEGCDVLNTEWTRERFLEAFVLRPETLLENRESVPAGDRLQDYIEELREVTVIDDLDLWTVPWVLCNNGTCTGSITKEDWNADRYGSCWNVLGKEIQDDETETFARSISICDVTGALSDLCVELLNAKADIEYANCIGSTEECEILSTFYTPAQYFTTNKAFSRETIRDFYLSQAADSCHGEPDRIQLAREENVIVQNQCFASTVETMKEALQFFRLAARMLLSVFLSMYQIIADLVMIPIYLGIQQDIAPLLRDIMHHLQQILRVLEETISTMMDLVLYLISTFGKVGQILAMIFSWICKIVSMIKYVFIDFIFCQLLRAQILAVVDLFTNIFNDISNIPLLGSLGMDKIVIWWKDNVHIPVAQAIAEVECPGQKGMGVNAPISQTRSAFAQGNGIGSVATDAFSNFDAQEVTDRWSESCNIPSLDEDAFAQDAAFVATRCWASPALGHLFEDTNSLGCTAADTCILDGIGDELGVCESCPAVLDVAAFSRFGCDLTLNKCRCNVPIFTRTSCIRNSDCLDSVPCRLMNDIESTTYGNVDCVRSCPNDPVCLVENNLPGSGGECVCLTERPKTKECDTAGSLVVMPIETGVCLLARDPILSRTIAVFSTTVTQVGHLAVARCALSNNRVCHNVQNRNGAIRPIVVGTDVLTIPDTIAGQRRLLWTDDGIPKHKTWMTLLPEIANNESMAWQGLCAEVMRANASVGLGPTDKMVKQECVKWRAVVQSMQILFSVNITNESRILTWDGMIEHFTTDRTWMQITTHPTEHLGAFVYVLSQIESMERVVEATRRFVALATRMWAFYGRPWLDRYVERGTVRHKRMWQKAKQARKTTQKIWNGTTQWGNYTTILARIAESELQDLSAEWNIVKQLHKNTTILPSYVNEFEVHTTTSRGPHRRLMQASQIAGVFGVGWPIDWSARIWQDRTGPVCEAFDIGYASLFEMWNETVNYYEQGYTGNRTNASLHVLDTLMHVPAISQDRKDTREQFVSSSRESVPELGILSQLLTVVFDAFSSLTQIDANDVMSFFDPGYTLQEQVDGDMFTLQRILSDLTHCNLHRLMTCDTKPRALVPTIIICLFIVWVASKLLWFLPDGFMTFIVFTLFPALVFWYAYGYSPTCSPMLPTCFMQDFVHAMTSTFPSYIEWPALLIHQDICSRDGVALIPEDRGTTNCFKSCASEEFRFQSWEDPFAWFFCEIDSGACVRTAQWVSNQTNLFTRFNTTTAYFAGVLAFDNYHLTEAHRMCGFLTGFYIVPAFLIAAFFILMIGTFLSSLLIIAFKAVAFTITSAGDDEDDFDDEEDEPNENERK